MHTEESSAIPSEETAGESDGEKQGSKEVRRHQAGIFVSIIEFVVHGFVELDIWKKGCGKWW